MTKNSTTEAANSPASNTSKGQALLDLGASIADSGTGGGDKQPPSGSAPPATSEVTR